MLFRPFYSFLSVCFECYLTLASDPAVSSASSVAMGNAYSSESTYSINGLIRKCGKHGEGKIL